MDRRSGGCWLCPVSETRMSRAAATVVFRHPRLLIAVVHCEAFTGAFVAGHVPVSDMQICWDVLRQQLKQQQLKGLDLIWLLDANGRVQADALYGIVGPIGDGSFCIPTSGLTYLFVYRLDEFDAWLPATFLSARFMN